MANKAYMDRLYPTQEQEELLAKTFMLLDGAIKLPKRKLVKIKQHREIPSHHLIKSCTVSRTKTCESLSHSERTFYVIVGL